MAISTRRGTPSRTLAKCRLCGKTYKKTEGFGQFCSKDHCFERIQNNANELINKSGPAFENWKTGMSNYLKKV